MFPLQIRDLLKNPPLHTPISICGWVRTRRDSKNLSFVELSDGSCQSVLQLVIDHQTIPDPTLLKNLQLGTSIRAFGKLVPSSGKEQAIELHTTKIEILGLCPPESYPLQKKKTSLEYLREIAHLRGRTNTFGAMIRVRNCLAMAIHQFFQKNHFLWVHTPIITTSDCEGAGAMFRVTTLNISELCSKGGEVNWADDFFGKEAFLTVSGQLEGETYACAVSRIYTFGPTFRAENSNTTRHLAEFWMVEPEAAFFELQDNIQLAQVFLQSIIQVLLDECPDELAFFERWYHPQLRVRLESIIQKSFVWMTYTEAIQVLERSGQPFQFPVGWGSDLQSEHERYLTEEYAKAPVIVTDYPRSIKAFYMRLNDDGQTVRAMDVLVPEIGEIIGGSQREERLDVLLENMRLIGINPDHYWWYIDLRRFGSVPHSGFGLGFERLIQYCTGLSNIRDCIPYPRYQKHAEF